MNSLSRYIIEKFKISKDIKNEEKDIHSYKGIVDIVTAAFIHCEKDKLYKQANPAKNTKKTIYLSKIDIEYISKLLKNTFDYDNLEYDMSLYTYIQDIIKINKDNIEDLLNSKHILIKNIDNPSEKYYLNGKDLYEQYEDIITSKKEY